MIRFMLGLLIVMGSVGGLEQDTMGFGQFFLWTGLGLGLMMFGAAKLATMEQ